MARPAILLRTLLSPLQGRLLPENKNTVRTHLCRRSHYKLTAPSPTDLKRELISEQVNWEISELNSTTALRRFGAPFKSDFGEVSPYDSELPILRYIFVHHVREFPFLDKAKEKEFWQDKLQVVRAFTGRIAYYLILTKPLSHI